MNDFERIAARAMARREKPRDFETLPDKGKTVSMNLTPTSASVPRYLIHDKRWEACEVVDGPTALSEDPLALTGIVRRMSGKLVARVYSVNGEFLELHDGEDCIGLNGETRRDVIGVFADEPGAAWLRGVLPDGRKGEEQSGLPGVDLELYSGVRNVLVVEGLKGLVAGAKWAGDVKQIRRFGGMPVIGYLPGAPGALGAIDWKLVTLRASDKTWEKIKSVLNIDVLRAGLR